MMDRRITITKTHETALAAAAWLFFNVLLVIAYLAVIPRDWDSLEATVVFVLISNLVWAGLMRLYRKHRSRSP
jgi:hypothetical protein